MEVLSIILYTHTLPNSTLSTIEYLTALIARIKLYVLSRSIRKTFACGNRFFTISSICCVPARNPPI